MWEMSALVFNNGSGFTKAGVAGDTAPKVVPHCSWCHTMHADQKIYLETRSRLRETSSV